MSRRYTWRLSLFLSTTAEAETRGARRSTVPPNPVSAWASGRPSERSHTGPNSLLAESLASTADCLPRSRHPHPCEV